MDIASRILSSTKYFTGFYFETPAMSHMEEVKQSLKHVSAVDQVSCGWAI